MQSLISWSQLLIVLFIFLVGYYAVMLFVFYRGDLSLSRAFQKSGRSLAPYASPATAPARGAEPDIVLYNTVHELMEDCKPVFQAAVAQQLEKEQVLEALRVRVGQYPQVKGTAFQMAVTNHIAHEMEHRLAMTLDDTEADGLWL